MEIPDLVILQSCTVLVGFFLAPCTRSTYHCAEIAVLPEAIQPGWTDGQLSGRKKVVRRKGEGEQMTKTNSHEKGEERLHVKRV